MQSLEAAHEEGEVTPALCDSLLNMVCTHNRAYKKAKLSTPRSSISISDNVPTHNDSPNTSASSNAPQKPQFCIHTKLLELYREESKRDTNQSETGLKCNTNLLEKLVARERLNTIILNLYPGNKGYSVAFPTHPLNDTCTEDTAKMIESEKWQYEETKLQNYLNQEELPAFIVDLLEPALSFLFYNGCIVTKVRDYRQAFPSDKCDIHHLLLRPSQQSVLADVNKIADEVLRPDDDGHLLADRKAHIESQILLAHHPTLQLNAKATALTTRDSRAQHNRNLLNSRHMRRGAMRHSQMAIYRNRKLMLCTQRPGLKLYEYLNQARVRPKSNALCYRLSKRAELAPIPAPRFESETIAPPTQAVNISKFKAHTPEREFHDPIDGAAFPHLLAICQPQLVEEYVLETDMHAKEPDKRRVYQMKLSILQRPLNGEYLGELYLDRDHRKGERNGVASRFTLGTSVQAKRYIEQFKEIFAESGRNSVRVRNHQPQTSMTQQTHSQQQGLSSSFQAVPVSNSIVNGAVNLVPTQQSAAVPSLQAQLQTSKQTIHDVNSEIAFNVLSTKVMNSVQQFQANAKHQAGQKSTCSNAALINLLNSSPATSLNSDANAAMVNAINNSQLLVQQQQQQQQQQPKLIGRKITVGGNARVLNAANVISVNNSRTLPDLAALQTQQTQQPQQITLTTVAGSNFYTTVPKLTAARNANDGGKTTLNALLIGTPAADCPEIVATNSNSRLMEKFANISSSSNKNATATAFIQAAGKHTVGGVQSAKTASLAGQSAQTINVQGLNYATIQGLQGLQVQLPGGATHWLRDQPMRAILNVASSAGLQGQSILLSVPVTTTANSAGGGGTNNSNLASAISVNSVGAPTVVLAQNSGTSNVAQLAAAGAKRAGTVLAQNSTPLQLVAHAAQRPRQLQQAQQQLQQARVHQFQAQQLQRQTPITIKMATTAGMVGTQATNVAQQVQKQLQHQQVQLQLTNQQQFHAGAPQTQQHVHLNKIARRSSQNVADPP